VRSQLRYKPIFYFYLQKINLQREIL